MTSQTHLTAIGTIEAQIKEGGWRWAAEEILNLRSALDRLTNAAAGFTSGYSSELTAAFHQAHGALRDSAVGDREIDATRNEVA